MSQTAQDIATVFSRTYPECDQAALVVLLNDADEEIQATVPFRKTKIDVNLVAGQFEYTLDETILGVWSARLWADPVSQNPLEETTIDELDIDPNLGLIWRNLTQGTPSKFYLSNNSTQGTIGVVPTSSNSTLLVLGASNATPVVITTTTHGLSDGSPVNTSNILGNTAANSPDIAQGQYYAKVTGYSTTTFALYSDSALTIPIAGNGAWTSGGNVLCSGSPKLTIDVTQRTVLTLASTMPLTPTIRDLYVSLMKFRYALQRKPDQAQLWKAEYDDNLAKQVSMTQRRAKRVRQKLQVVRQRANWRGGGLRNDD